MRSESLLRGSTRPRASLVIAREAARSPFVLGFFVKGGLSASVSEECSLCVSFFAEGGLFASLFEERSLCVCFFAEGGLSASLSEEGGFCVFWSSAAADACNLPRPVVFRFNLVQRRQCTQWYLGVSSITVQLTDCILGSG